MKSVSALKYSDSMNNKTLTNNPRLLGTFLLALLLLTLPCPVRHFLQFSIGIETTKPLNPSKTSHRQFSCTTEANVTTKTNVKYKFTQNYLPLLTSPIPLSVRNELNKGVPLVETYFSGVKLPYYILYRRLIIYDSDAFTVV